MEKTKLKLVQYKQILLDKLRTDTNNPTNRIIKEWTADHIRPNRLIHTMEREGLVKIEKVQEGKTVRRYIIPQVDTIKA